MGKVTAKGKRKAAKPATAEKIAAALRARSAPADQARLYADMLLEYRSAMKNITKRGSVVADARTGKPMQNPFLPVRDRALGNLERLGRRLDVAWLWE